MLVAQPAIANSPTIESSVINPPYGPSIPTGHSPSLPSNRANKKAPQDSIQQSGRHSTRAEKQVNPDSLQRFLTNAHIPLNEYAEQIANSPYSSTIIGICWIEQHGCTRAPSWNFWGIKGNGQCGKSGRGFAKYCTAEEGIQAISDLLARYENKGKDTIEELNGYYVVPASQNWFNTVLKIKQQVENL